MFDLLTLDELYDLHHKVCEEGATVHGKIMVDGRPITSDHWRALAAKAAELHETAEALYAEIQRRGF